MPRKQNKLCSGISLGDSLVEVPVLTEEEVWPTDKAAKRGIYSFNNFIRVGGRTGSESEDEEVDEEDATVEEQEQPAKKATTEDKLPIFHHEYPKVLAAETMNLYSVVGVINLTVGAGT